MRKSSFAALFAAGLGVFVSAAVVAGSDDPAAEGQAYIGFAFGGQSAAEARDGMHYGLRLNHDNRYDDRPSTPLFQLDFSRQGGSARLNGMELSRKSYRLNQDEEVSEEDAGEVEEEGGFFSAIGNFFSNLFGGDEEEAAEAEEETLGDAAGEGWFANYETVDFVLLGVGAVALGYLATEAFGGDERRVDNGGGDDGADDGGEECPIPLPPPLPCPVLQGKLSSASSSGADAAYQEWLDGGTGHMGDLGELSD